MLMYYSRTLLSRRTERALACLAGVLLLSPLAAGELALARTRQTDAPTPSALTGFPEYHEIVAVADARIEVTFRLANSATATRIVEITRRALPRVISWFGPQAQPALTVADVPWTPRGRCVASPGQVTISSRWLQPESDSGLERAVIAALARQPFFALGLGTDDGFVEAMARFATIRAINDSLDGSQFLTERFFGGFVPQTLRPIALSRRPWDPRPFVRQFDSNQTHLPCVPADAIASPVDRRATAVMVGLLSLERAIGWSSMQSAMTSLATRFAGRTPTAADLVAIISEQRGVPPALFVAALSGDAGVDYAIDELSSERNPTGGTYRTVVRARRTPTAVSAGESSWPAPLTIGFAGGDLVREPITDSRDEVRFEYDSPLPAAQASIDADSVMLFDTDRRNNTRAIAPRLPIYGLRRLLNWLVWLQDAALTGTALV